MRVFMRKLTLVMLDVFLLTIALYLAIATKFGVKLTKYYLSECFMIWGTLVVVGIVCNSAFKLYNSLWRYASIDELFLILSSGVLTGIVFFGAMNLLDIEVAYSVYFLTIVYNTIFLGLSRLGYRMLRMVSSTTSLRLDQDVKRVLIIGQPYWYYGY